MKKKPVTKFEDRYTLSELLAHLQGLGYLTTDDVEDIQALHDEGDPLNVVHHEPMIPVPNMLACLRR
jgi:hypothetical protein